MSKIIQFNSLGGPEVLEFKDISLSKELGSEKLIEGIFKPKIDKSFLLKALLKHINIC